MAKPMIAVLGLEVVDPSGTPSAQDTQVAKEMTDGLRSRAKAGTGAYQLAPGSDKELIDQKLLNNCDSEAPACMSSIGSQLGAEILMFGKLQKEPRGGYQVTLKVLDVNRKVVSKSSQDLIPASDASGAALQGWAKRIYAKLTGEQNAGTVVVKLTNADRGTILIDGEEKGNITNGSGQVSGLSEGKYKLAVESDGFRRWDRDITVSAGQATTIPVDLEKGSGPSGNDFVIGGNGSGSSGDEGGSGHGSRMWKGVFIGSLVVAAGGAGWLAYNYKQIQDNEDIVRKNGGYDMPSTADTPAEQAAVLKANEDNKSARTQTWVGGVILGVGGAVAVLAFYKGFIASNSNESSTSASRGKHGKRVRRDRFVVTPIMSPDGGGATVRLDF
jgi:hypothetical protein